MTYPLVADRLHLIPLYKHNFDSYNSVQYERSSYRPRQPTDWGWRSYRLHVFFSVEYELRLRLFCRVLWLLPHLQKPPLLPVLTNQSS